MDEPSPGDLAALALTERELFSLYVQYPEIDFDPESPEKMPHSTEHFSSPKSNACERDELEPVQNSNSTRHTTPLRHCLFGPTRADDNEYSSFCSQLRDCDLPNQTVLYFQTLGSSVVQLGGCLLAEEHKGAADSGTCSITEISDTLLLQLQHSTSKCKEQIDTIAFVTELAPFNILPTDVALWSNYRQRATLINKHLSSPSHTELTLLAHLAQLFDAYVYNPFLHLTLTQTKHLHHQASTSTKTSINALYDALMGLLAAYQRWYRAMRAFRQTHMTPIMRRIQDSPWIQREIEQMELTLEAARSALSRDPRSAAGLVLTDDQINGAKEWAQRRVSGRSSGVSSRMGRRYRREAHCVNASEGC